MKGGLLMLHHWMLHDGRRGASDVLVCDRSSMRLELDLLIDAAPRRHELPSLDPEPERELAAVKSELAREGLTELDEQQEDHHDQHGERGHAPRAAAPLVPLHGGGSVLLPLSLPIAPASSPEFLPFFWSKVARQKVHTSSSRARIARPEVLES